MRKSKYRGQKVSDGTWVYGSLSLDCDDKPFIRVAGYGADGKAFDSMVEVKPESVGQFTEVFAKNKPVYENDIVQYISEWDGINHVFTEKVVFEEGSFLAGECGRELAGCFDLQVVGNTSDDPEMEYGFYKDA